MARSGGVRTSATTRDERAWRAGQAAAAWIVPVQAVLLVGMFAFFVAVVRGELDTYWSVTFLGLTMANLVVIFARSTVADRGVDRAQARSVQRT